MQANVILPSGRTRALRAVDAALRRIDAALDAVQVALAELENDEAETISENRVDTDGKGG